MSNRNDLTSGGILGKLLLFAVPYLFASFLQAFYSAVDMFVVGQYSGAASIAAVNIGGQVMQMITSFVIGISMGTTVCLGQAVGAGNEKDASDTVGTTVLMFGIFSLVIVPVMLLLGRQFVDLMHTPADAWAETLSYVRICSVGLPFIVAYNVIAALFRGIGDSRTPMYFIAAACVCNILGDVLFVKGFGMGAAGAAAATVGAQMISSLSALLYMKRKGLSFPLTKENFHLKQNHVKRILTVGIPVAMQDTLIGLSFIVLTVIANNRGLIASSAVGVTEKLICFMFLVPSAMLATLSAVTAQCVGAGKKERAEVSLRYGIAVTVAFGAAMCALSWIMPEGLAGIFTTEAEVKTAAGEYLRSYSVDCMLAAVTFCLNGYLCGLGKSMIPFIHSVLSIFLVRIPAAYLLSVKFPTTLLPMGCASPLGSVASMMILAVYFLFLKHRRQA